MVAFLERSDAACWRHVRLFDCAPRHVTDEAIDLARRWVAESAGVQGDASAQRLAGVLKDPDGLPFTIGFVDGVMRRRACPRRHPTSRGSPRSCRSSCRGTCVAPYRSAASSPRCCPRRSCRSRGASCARWSGIWWSTPAPDKLGPRDREDPRERRAAQPQPARRSGARREGGAAPARGDPRPRPPARRGLRLGQGLGDREPHLDVGVRRRRRAGCHATVAAVPHGRDRRHVHQPRHGGVPRPRPHDRRLHPTARGPPPSAARGGHRAAGLPARRPARTRGAHRVGARSRRRAAGRASRCAW